MLGHYYKVYIPSSVGACYKENEAPQEAQHQQRPQTCEVVVDMASTALKASTTAELVPRPASPFDKNKKEDTLHSTAGITTIKRFAKRTRKVGWHL